ncbi:sugar transferase [Desulfosoma sp.]
MLPKSDLLTVRFADLAVTPVALAMAYVIKQYLLPGSLRGLSPETEFLPLITLTLLIRFFVFHYLEVPMLVSRFSLWDTLRVIYKAILISMALLLGFLYALKIPHISRLYLFSFMVSDAALLSAIRVFYFRRLSDKYPLHRVLFVVVGARGAAAEVVERVCHKLKNIEVIGCLETEPGREGSCVCDDVKVIGNVKQLDEILKNQVVDEILFVVPLQHLPELEDYLRAAEYMGVTIRIIPHWYMRKYIERRPKYYHMYFEMIGGIPSLVLSASPWNRTGLAIKSALDFVGALILLIVSAPLMVIIALMIKKISPGPIFYRQIRCGLYGRQFAVYKFRTMIVGAENLQEEMKEKNVADGPVFKALNDPRVIPGVGSFLRATGLDELPQLINVLRGEMSLVGPRPPLPSEVQQYDLWQRRRLTMKPGITCLWQISRNRHRMPFQQWMQMDLDYIDNWSLWLDFKILFKTLFVPFQRLSM